MNHFMAKCQHLTLCSMSLCSIGSRGAELMQLLLWAELLGLYFLRLRGKGLQPVGFRSLCLAFPSECITTSHTVRLNSFIHETTRTVLPVSSHGQVVSRPLSAWSTPYITQFLYYYSALQDGRKPNAQWFLYLGRAGFRRKASNMAAPMRWIPAWTSKRVCAAALRELN